MQDCWISMGSKDGRNKTNNRPRSSGIVKGLISYPFSARRVATVVVFGALFGIFLSFRVCREERLGFFSSLFWGVFTLGFQLGLYLFILGLSMSGFRHTRQGTTKWDAHLKGFSVMCTLVDITYQ